MGHLTALDSKGMSYYSTRGKTPDYLDKKTI
jgi:hypothetical protein